MKFFCFCLIFQFIYLVRGKGQLKTLDETSWSDMLQGEWMVELYVYKIRSGRSILDESIHVCVFKDHVVLKTK